MEPINKADQLINMVRLLAGYGATAIRCFQKQLSLSFVMLL
jgi:hypothetical protein